MVLFWSYTLFFSCFGLIVLLGIKHYELATGKIFFGRFRAMCGIFLRNISLWIERILPTLVRMYSKILWRLMMRFIHKTTALSILRVERFLEQILKILRQRTEVRRIGEASLFLKEVSEYKRKLIRANKDKTK